MDKPTEKQIRAFYNMQHALGWNSDTPETKADMSKKIGEMKREIHKRISITGVIRPIEGIHF